MLKPFFFQIGSLVQPIDDRIKKYIKKTVAESNITSSTQMKLLLDNHIKHELFKDSQMPSAINSRFWPSLKVIRNYILLGLMEIRNSNVDQVCGSINKYYVFWLDPLKIASIYINSAVVNFAEINNFECNTVKPALMTTSIKQ